MLEASRSSRDPDADVEGILVENPSKGSRPVCPVCGSTNVSDTTCIEHLVCGYTASIATFEFNDFICPRCGKKLVKEHTDYRKVVLRVCHDCGHIARIKEVIAPGRFRGDLHVGRKSSLLMNMNSWINHIDSALRRLGLKHVRNYEVRGESGTIHRWNFAVWLSEGEKPEIIIKLELMNPYKSSLRPLDSIFDILSTAIRKEDSGIKHLILIIDCDGADRLLEICEELNIKLVPAHRKELFTETLKDLVGTIRDHDQRAL